MKVHVELVHMQKRLSCVFCGKEVSEVHMQRHIRSVHQGVRYNCPECDKFFTQERNMKMHVKVIHLRETILSCDQCEYTTLWKDSMHQHIKTKHEGVAYECHICLKSLSSQRQLQKHIEVVHCK